MNEFKIKNGLVVSGSADVEQNLTVNGILTAKQYNVSLISSSILFESGSTQFGNTLDDNHLFTGSIKVTGSISLNGQAIGTGKLDETTFQNYTSSTDSRLGLLENSTGSIRNDFNSFTSSYTNVSGSLDSRLDTLETLSGSFTGSFSGSFVGDGTNLFNIPASGVTGLNLTQIADGSVTASVSNTNGLRVNSKSEITGSLIVTNGITGSIDYSNLTNVPTLVSGSSQISITGTTGYSTFSSSISSSIDLLSSSIATTDSNQNTRLGLLETSTGSLNSFTSSASERLTSIETSTSSLNSFTSSALTRVGAIETSTSSLNSFTSSALTRVSAIETSTGSLNSFTSSIDTTIKTKLNTENVISGSVQVNITGTTGYSTFSSSISSSIGSLSSSVATTTNNLSSSIDTLSGSISTTNLNQSNRIGNLEVSSGSLNSFTSSINTTIKNKLNTDGVISGSVQVDITSTTGYSTFSSSIATTDLNQNNRLDSIQTSTGSLNSFTSSIDTTIKNKLNTDGVISGSSQVLNGTTIHSGAFFNGISVVSGSGQIAFGGITGVPSGLVSGSSQVDITSTTNYTSFSSSIATTDLNQNTRLGLLETSTGSLNSFTSSIDTTIKNKLNSDGVISGSSQISLSQTNGYSAFSSSIASTDFVQDGRLTSIESKTGSYATTGSNIFKGNQTISGSVIITENLTVFGSSSITYVTSSQLRVEDNVITVNTASPGSRFGGLEVHDSGSVGIATGSLLWDSVNNRWIYQQSSEATYGGGVLLSGPRSSGSLGSELTLTNGKIARSAGGDHLNDSIITEYGGTTIGISGNLEISGSLVIPSTPLVSGSSQIIYSGVTGIPSGIVSGSSQVLLSSGVWSGSAQLPSGIISGAAQLPSGTVSGSSQVLLSSGVWSGSAQLPSGIISGSSQLPSGTVSGSSQITYSSITGIPSGIISGSSQVSFGSISGIPSGLVSGSSQVSFGSISGVPSGLVSGSSQVLSGTGIWSGSSQLPSGVVSGSSQITYGSISSIPSGIVSGSSQILLSSGIWSGSAQLPSGVVSGSAQIIANLPSGTVSGSSQITLTSTQVTNGLGYTPYNSSNPNGYITGISFANVSSKPTTLSGYGITDSIKTNGTLTGNIDSDWGESFTTFDPVPSGTPPLSSPNIRTVNIGNNFARRTQLAFDYASDVAYFRRRNDSGWQTWREFIHSGNIGSQTVATAGALSSMNISQFTNNSGYLTSITSGNVTTALGYTPYNATNPSGYISSITSGNVTTALGYTPYNATNPNGYITSAGSISGTASNITAFTINQSVGSGNTPTFAGLTVGAGVATGRSSWGSFTNANIILSSSASDSTGNCGIEFRSGNNYPSDGAAIFFENNASGGASERAKLTIRVENDAEDFMELRAGNITLNANTVSAGGQNPSIIFQNAGTTISSISSTGVYNGSISGNAATATTAGALTSMNISQFTNNSNYITGISFANVSSKPTTISGYGITDAITTGNIGSQSVSYASSAGSAPNAGNLNASYGVSTGGGNGLKFWGGSDLYKIHMGSSAEYYYGPVTDYSIKCNIDSNGSTRGFTWGQSGVTPIAALNVGNGNMQIAGTFTTGGSILPLSNNSVNLGSPSLGWANVYTNDLHLSNMNKPEGNDVDGTKGTWTIQEGAENLYIINNNNGKKFKINLEEII
jgi:hypothetical protein